MNDYQSKNKMTEEQALADDKSFKYQTIKRIAVLSKKGNESKELRLISYRESLPKYDIRTWTYEGKTEKLGKGITLSAEELAKLQKAIYMEQVGTGHNKALVDKITSYAVK